jgi:hypothetical protein
MNHQGEFGGSENAKRLWSPKSREKYSSGYLGEYLTYCWKSRASLGRLLK